MRIVFISDTHSLHRQVRVPGGDVLVHCGDVLGNSFNREQLEDFAEWLQEQPHEHKVMVPGNHDGLFERHEKLARSTMGPEVHVLIDQGVRLAGLNFWGSPYTPKFGHWYFNKGRGPALDSHWAMIPDDTDVLVTHGPPYGLLDYVEFTEEHVGCFDLLRHVTDRVKPKAHAFGHIHGGYGQLHFGGTKFVNAAQLDESYRVENRPISIDIP